MTDRLDLPLRYREQLEALLRAHVPDAEVWAYGSRVNGRSHDGSDLDLVLRSPTLKPLGGEYLDFIEALHQSNIPILVQARDWARLPDSFHREIEREYVVVQDQAEETPAGNWRELTLGEVLELKRGYDLPQRLRSPGSVPLVSSSGITDFHAEAKVKGPGVITGRYGTLGKVYFVKEDFWPLNTTLYVRDFKDNDPRFISYFLRSLDFSAYSDKAAVPGLNRNHLHEAPVRIPPPTEQRAIAHVLGTLDDKIELNRCMSQTLEEMARALFKSWFVDFDPVRAKVALKQYALANHADPNAVPSGNGAAPGGEWTVERARAYLDAMDPQIADLFPDRLVPSELGEMPEGWEVKALGELVELAYGKALRAADRKDGTVPVYGSNGQVGWHDEKLVVGPGIVVGRKGNPGVVTWAHGDFYPIDTTFYVVPRNANFGVHFLFFALSIQDLPSVAADSAVPGLNRKLAYMNMQLLPNTPLVAEFNDYARDIFSRRHRLQSESRYLAAQRDALLPELMSGLR